MIVRFVLAQADSPLDKLGPRGSQGDNLLGGSFITLGAILFTILALLFLAVKIGYSLRKRRRRRKSRRRERKSSVIVSSPPEKPVKKRPQSASRRRHAKRNPTLAESGGLPPARPEGQAPPEPKP